VPRVVEDLKTKKAWFEANQARVTAEAIAKAEAEIQRLTKGKGDGGALLDDWPNKGPADAPAADAAAADERSSDDETGQPEEVQEAEAS
jgi:hypothetical protein